MIESTHEERKVNKVIVKDLSLSNEDPYSFAEWDTKPFLLTGELCLIGSTIHQAQIRLVDSSFVRSGRSILTYSLKDPISLPQIRSIQSMLMTLYSLLSQSPSSIPSQSLSQCASVRFTYITN